MKNESEHEFNRIHDGWYDEFRPESFYETELVDILIENHWFRDRTVRCFNEAEAEAEAARDAGQLTKSMRIRSPSSFATRPPPNVLFLQVSKLPSRNARGPHANP